LLYPIIRYVWPFQISRSNTILDLINFKLDNNYMGQKSNSKELEILRDQNKAFRAQNRLFEMLFEITRTSSGKDMMKTTMQNALDSITDISGAKNGSLFLLNKEGMVTDSLLAKEDLRPEKRNQLIGKILNKGLAGWVMESLEVGIINDTKKDSRWITLPNRPYEVRSALTVPILRRQFLYGILTLMHPDPNYFDDNSVSIIQMTADQLAVAIENTQFYIEIHESHQELLKANEKIEKISDALKSEIKKGQKIQTEFLPHKIPSLEGCEIDTFFQPAMQLSGDFYDFFMLPNNLLGVVLADISDKGIGAALFMALIRSLIRVFSGHFKSYDLFQKVGGKKDMDINDVLNAVSLTNEYLTVEHGDEGMFATLFFGIFDPYSGELTYTNCGHEPLMVINNSGIKKFLKPLGPALGIFPGIKYKFEKIRLEKESILFGFTDGVTEARSPSGELYTRKKLESSVNRSPVGSVDQFLNNIKKDLFDFIGSAIQADDITIFTIQKK